MADSEKKPDLSATLVAGKVAEILRKERDSRPSEGSIQREERTWREHIRFAVVPLLLFGFALMGREVWEIVACPRTETCHVHMSTMAWGIGLVVLALLIWQQGNVSKSITEAVAAGADIRARWFTRPGRESDTPGTKVTTVIEEPPPDKEPGT
ncbi:MAG: hypothetical protein ACR652_24660 [Methylocystis sp.]|uniref:hypothetical protein n=1 Tax=Methylocystis sp. TaxID=1911079 RepID=UPI003DA5A28B